MTPMQAKEHLRSIFNLPFADPSIVTDTGKAIEAAVKFIEENYFEWVPIQGDAEDQALPPEDEVVMLCYEAIEIPEYRYYTKAYVVEFDGEIEWFMVEYEAASKTIIPIAWKRLLKLVKYEPAETQPEAPKTSSTVAPDLTQDTTVIFNINHKQ